MAPMRAAATHDTSHAGSFGNSTPILVPFTAPASTRRVASARDRRSRSAKLSRSSGVTRNTLSPQRSADALTALATVGGKSGNTGSVMTQLAPPPPPGGSLGLDAHVLDGADALDVAGDD